MDNVTRIKIYDETKEISLQKYPNVEKSIKYKYLNIEMIPRFNKTIVKVVNNDTINATLDLKRNNYHPILLNMSDHYMPGGCVLMGYSSQEESCFRRTNYFLTLKRDFYPMCNIDTIYSPNVTVFRKDEESKYEIMEKEEHISFIASPAICGPKTDYDNTTFTDKDEIDLAEEKIRMIFKTAYKHNHDSLVLSAWGCGVFHNPGEHISRMFKEIIHEYDGCFKIIVFAIMENNSSWRPWLPQKGSAATLGNFQIFKNTFKSI